MAATGGTSKNDSFQKSLQPNQALRMLSQREVRILDTPEHLFQAAADEFQQFIRRKGFLKEIFAAAQLELPSGYFGAVPAGEDDL